MMQKGKKVPGFLKKVMGSWFENTPKVLGSLAFKKVQGFLKKRLDFRKICWKYAFVGFLKIFLDSIKEPWVLDQVPVVEKCLYSHTAYCSSESCVLLTYEEKYSAQHKQRKFSVLVMPNPRHTHTHNTGQSRSISARPLTPSDP